MIIETTGDLLVADVDALVNTVNTIGIMGKGIALQFRYNYPVNYALYREACQQNKVRLGEMFVVDTGQLGPRRFIINFPTKGHWRSMSQLTDIQSGLRDLTRVICEREITSIAIPALGCGNGGLNWAVVRPVIIEAMNSLPEVSVYMFSP